MLISIIIKTLNEEKRVEASIQSALAALEELNVEGEVIVADSASTDRTITIAQNYPVKVVTIKNPVERSCGIGSELGYRVSTGKFIYILDGDMTLCVGFLPKAIEILIQNPQIAGVGGLIEEMILANFAMIGRKENPDTSTPNQSPLCLNMGGLYRRAAIKSIDYFTNRSLHSFEEFELGVRLHNAGWRLIRIPILAAKHYGPDCSSPQLLKRRWQTKYSLGSGELLRSSITKPYFLKTICNLKIYRIQLLTILIWLISFLSLFYFGNMLSSLCVLLGMWLVIVFALLINKKNFARSFYSITAWNLSVVGCILGFIHSEKHSPTDEIDFNIIQ